MSHTPLETAALLEEIKEVVDEVNGIFSEYGYDVSDFDSDDVDLNTVKRDDIKSVGHLINKLISIL
ncbi:hypothetical protein Xoosp13_165 [Xanthomonas phage Xoo-sp13]|nr:hypothetical protein Xoosp13_165 [Xanthomonas phage Xoo-sp13]